MPKKAVARKDTRRRENRPTKHVNGSSKGTTKVLRTSGKIPVVHCMFAPTDGETLLLPTSAMAEVIDFEQLAPAQNAPPWLLGQLSWENRQVPVFSFTALINGTPVGEISERSKILILKSLADASRVPYLGVLLSGLPRITNLRPEDFVETGDEKKALGVFCRILCEGQESIIPDIDRLTHLVTHATYGALPITQLDD
ncbi:MAG: chemotaxis protein CheW [Xanthomonadales bacterium]|nr:chemotaxis protein CheW [Xanthomonadales bacterium]